MNNKISELVKKTLGNLGCEKIVLFGSRARGDFSESSDYGICCIGVLWGCFSNMNWRWLGMLSST